MNIISLKKDQIQSLREGKKITVLRKIRGNPSLIYLSETVLNGRARWFDGHVYRDPGCGHGTTLAVKGQSSLFPIVRDVDVHQADGTLTESGAWYWAITMRTFS